MAHTLDQAETLLKRAHAEGRLAHAFLVSGSRDSGKEELVCRISDMLNGRRGDDLASSESELLRVVRPVGKTRVIKVDDMRNMERELYAKVGSDDWKIGVIADADRLNPASENAFLKTLEEPPPNTIIFLLTAQPSRLLPTIHSRCVQLDLMETHDQRSLDREGLALVELVKDLFSEGLGNETRALTVYGRLATLFADLKEAYEEESKLAFAKDQEHYKETTESGAWLREREANLAATAASSYLTGRSKVINLLVAWFGDALRLKGGGDYLEMPELVEQSRLIADRESMSSLLRRMEALETMQSELETNASEALVMEVGCLRAFVA